MLESKEERCIAAGKYLRQCRDVAGLTQREVANRIGVVNFPILSRWERGIQFLPTTHWGKYAQALDVPKRRFTLTLLKYKDPELYKCLVEASD